MNLNNAALVISAVSDVQYPDTKMPEVAFVGRSNVGKSSFINKILNRKNLAHTSSKPGKTATINFYNIDNQLMLVDLPGYGYAAVSKAEKEKWAEMIDFYLYNREHLSTIFIIVDARHKPTADDKLMYDFIKSRQEGCVIVATKIDKLSKSEINKNLCVISDALKIDDADILIPFSAETGLGVDKALEVLGSVAEKGI
ncbi:MAG: ribosome biogenesis GTP-binding protein YihA/YsxC [Bacillota bacterium]|nr:ribosome biogenesis GTP-binding protein YihA/YsxC [Bacillota bacterium]